MSQTKEVRYTARSITPPPKRRPRSRSPDGSQSPAKSRSPAQSRSRSPVRSQSRSPARSRSPAKSRSRSRSRSPARSRSRSPVKSRKRSRSRSFDAKNPGNNLYVTGLSTRITSSELERLFSKEGKVEDCQIVADPRTKESRGFAFVKMATAEEAERCIKYLNRTVIEGRRIMIERAKRSRERTPTPGKYCGSRVGRARRRSRSRSPYRYRRRSRSRSRGRRDRSRSPYGRDSHRRHRDNGYRRYD
ncbi:RNA-binding (RRM/RBD/RNP motifs) family protein [Rhynchospora pubera]|uniref:RNA-binding (RRM/RBD/RNP motifs) family protein n=1 Tax=Rhynchospora pubera TaxID=906938 RepID=A0AAV8GQZ1_9POAL|nr:RNA-binding (RRM/RBD/RNP motifs) family protein [Rhynchospora pubera]KAJ4778452.1 RNA-binding (RRM/RBD/RNP motifs) family protein [Rhynchospora pubera]KAJ4806011.1 RNA-binding (RRM/RBD/RNP motifs) family protein [Rhynchospora pubera]